MDTRSPAASVRQLEQVDSALSDLRFLKTATVNSISESAEQLSAIQEAGQWYKSVNHQLQARAALSREVESCLERILLLVNSLRKEEEKLRINPPFSPSDGIWDKETAGHGEHEPNNIQGGESSSDENGWAIIDNGDLSSLQAEASDHKSRQENDSGLQSLRAEAQTTLDELRVLRAKWHAGGRMFERWGGQVQGRHFRDPERSNRMVPRKGLAASGEMGNKGHGNSTYQDTQSLLCEVEEKEKQEDARAPLVHDRGNDSLDAKEKRETLEKRWKDKSKNKTMNKQRNESTEKQNQLIHAREQLQKRYSSTSAKDGPRGINANRQNTNACDQSPLVSYQRSNSGFHSITSNDRPKVRRQKKRGTKHKQDQQKVNESQMEQQTDLIPAAPATTQDEAGWEIEHDVHGISTFGFDVGEALYEPIRRATRSASM